MVREIGVRELKVKASEIVRNMRKRRTRYVITYRGRPVGRLEPFEQAEPIGTNAAVRAATWDELTRLGQEIARGWPADRTSAEVLAEMRR
jgi:prevent-host-death family protein